MAILVIACYRRLLDGAVHALDLATGPWIVRLDLPVLDPEWLADQVEPHRPRKDGVPVSGLLCELDAVIRQDCVDFARRRLQKMFQELPGCLMIGFVYQLSDCALSGSIYGHEEIEITFFGPDLGNANVKKADWVALELLSFWLVALDVRQTRNLMPLRTPMQGRACQMRDRRL